MHTAQMGRPMDGLTTLNMRLSRLCERASKHTYHSVSTICTRGTKRVGENTTNLANLEQNSVHSQWLDVNTTTANTTPTTTTIPL
jgi:hypothetical protein